MKVGDKFLRINYSVILEDIVYEVYSISEVEDVVSFKVYTTLKSSTYSPNTIKLHFGKSFAERIFIPLENFLDEVEDCV